LEIPETRPFWSGQDTNSVAVSGMSWVERDQGEGET
jgi:hypothetical protein